MATQTKPAFLTKRTPHYLKPTGETRVPRLHLCLDTQARTTVEGELSRQTWRLGAGRWLRGHNERGWQVSPTMHYSDPLQLWADVNYHARPGKRIIIWSHHLAYHLRISNALQWLPAMGYKCESIALSQDASWARFVGERGTVVMTDFMSWCPASLSRIYSDLGIPGPYRPEVTDSDEDWARFCDTNTTVLASAVLSALSWVEADDLGPWRPTGPGQSHSAWRRRHLTHKVLVHDDVAALRAERRAMWTGRAEAWRHGKIERAPLYEYDMSLAYCQIGADCNVPTVLMGRAPDTDNWKAWLRTPFHAILARVTTTTKVPTVPCEHDGGIVWPVGTFETTLWGPELDILHGHTNAIEVHDMWVYRAEPALSSICSYVNTLLQDESRHAHPVIKRIAKHWARTIVGRTALQYGDWQPFGTSPTYDICLSTMLDTDTGIETQLLQLGYDLQVCEGKVESPESVPQIASYIMSECRRRLWRLMCVVGLRHVYYVDTDSIITDEVGRWRIQRQIDAHNMYPLHLKGVYRSATIHGPRMLEVDDERRYSGIPLRARRVDGGGFDSELMMSLSDSLQERDHAAVRLMYRHFAPGPNDTRREHLPDGTTKPIRRQ